VGATSEKSLRLIALASSVRVGPNQFPKVNELLKEACAVLDMQDPPELYISQSEALNARTIGVDTPFITLNSRLLEVMSEAELLGIIGHEVGHILSGHVLYKTLLWFLMNAANSVFRLPLGRLALNTVLASLREWDRKSELSADRAAVLVTQDPDSSYTSLMKVAGGNRLEEMQVEEFIRQAEEYDSAGDVVDGVYKMLNILGQSHPFPVLRLVALRQWITSGEYQKVVDGAYTRRDSYAEESVMNDFQEAAKQYQDDFQKSKDPLAEAVKSIGANVENARRQAEGFIRSIFER
jgi:Zn-dependent protease with chaperone function